MLMRRWRPPRMIHFCLRAYDGLKKMVTWLKVSNYEPTQVGEEIIALCRVQAKQRNLLLNYMKKKILQLVEVMRRTI